MGDEEVWQKARAMNKDLKGRMTSKLNADHVHTYELNWTAKGIKLLDIQGGNDIHICTTLDIFCFLETLKSVRVFNETLKNPDS